MKYYEGELRNIKKKRRKPNLRITQLAEKKCSNHFTNTIEYKCICLI